MQFAPASLPTSNLYQGYKSLGMVVMGIHHKPASIHLRRWELVSLGK